MIITEKAKEKQKLSKGIAHTTMLAKKAWASSSFDLAKRYIWAMSNVDLDASKKLGLTGIKKYQKRAWQVELELD